MTNGNHSFEDEVPYLVKMVPAQLGPADRRVYYNAAKECLTKDGMLVDTGTLAGGTSVALAFGGLAAPSKRSDQFLYAFDKFTCDWTIPEFFSASFGGDWEIGSNFRHVYEDVISPFRRFVKIYEGDLLGFGEWTGQSIDVMGVDVWKQQDLAIHSLKIFFPHLRRGSVILHQDYMTVWLPRIHIYTEALSSFLERVYETPYSTGCTVAFRVIDRIPISAIEEAIGLGEDIGACQRLMASAKRTAMQPETALFVEMAHTVTKRKLESREAALHWLDQVSIPGSVDARFFEERRAEMSAYVNAY